MAKRVKSSNGLIKVNPYNQSAHALMTIAILNGVAIAGTALDDKDFKQYIKIPERKELLKILKSDTSFKNICKALDEVNGIRIREVGCIEAIGHVGIIPFDHPFVGIIPVLAFRVQSITEDKYVFSNAGLGIDEGVMTVETYTNKFMPDEKEAKFYQIILNSGIKISNTLPDSCCCENCDRYFIDSLSDKEICLYDNTNLESTNYHCNKYSNTVYWKGECSQCLN